MPAEACFSPCLAAVLFQPSFVFVVLNLISFYGYNYVRKGLEDGKYLVFINETALTVH